MKKGSKDNSKNVVIAIAVTAIITSLVLVLLMDRSFLGNGNYAEANPFDDANGGQDQVPSGSPVVPQDPYLQISVSPSILDRAEVSLCTITSNLRNALVDIQVLYKGVDLWLDAYNVYLDNLGRFSEAVPMNNAGEWQVRATYYGVGGTRSNVVDLTVRGITLYQEKDTWSPGEKYSASLTGTYKNWHVALFVKDSSEVNWIYALSSLTDENGRIPYNVNWATIDASQLGKDKDVIAVLSPNDASGSELPEMFQQVQGLMVFSSSQLDGLVSSGRIVKSNILSVHIR